MRTISKVLFIFFLITSFYSCTKDISVKTPPADKMIEETASKSNPGPLSMMGGYPSGDYYSHFADLFNGNYGVYVVPMNVLHHIYKWELLLNGIIISSGNVNIYDQGGAYEYLTTINNPSAGTYTINIYTDAFWNGRAFESFGPPDSYTPFVSSESILQTNTSGNVNIHRYWSSYNTDHFYTKTKTYYKDYEYENIEYAAWAGGGSGLAPFYRYLNTSIKDHYYTTTFGSYSGYQYETIEGYVQTSSGTGLRPLYQYWNASIKDHFYTVTSGTYSGYAYEGIAGYVQ